MKAKIKQRGVKSVASALTGATIVILTGWQIAHQTTPASEAQLAQIITGYGLLVYGRAIRK